VNVSIVNAKPVISCAAILASVILASSDGLASTPAAAIPDKGYTSFLSGNPKDVTTPTTGGLLIQGGGKEVDDAFRWLVRHSGGGNIVVLRCYGTDDYNPYFFSLGKVASVETIVINSREGASSDYVNDKVRHAEAVFISGGNQANYWNYFHGTPLQQSLNSIIHRGVPVGGTSAGMAIMGSVSYTALNNSEDAAQALADPYNSDITFGSKFIDNLWMKGVITDTHFYQRDRMGRLVTFLARITKDGLVARPRAIAADQETAVLVEPDGKAKVVGKGHVYFMTAPGQPQFCKAGKPLTYNGVKVFRVSPGGTFDLSTWTGEKGAAYYVSAEAGKLSSTQAGGSPY
jgi:cyanophycinase